jgi:NAD(P)-dependent dehydrogenase (short-subunit alcohol dehydrogenase family)
MPIASRSRMSWQDKVAIVTGGASGIGRATAIAFARAGARVAVVDRNPAGEGTLDDIRPHGTEAIFVGADVSSSRDVHAMVGRIIDRFGRIDYAFNNAGIEGVSKSAAEYPEDDWNRVLATNLTGIWLCMKAELAHMKRGAAIVNCASIAGLVGFTEEAAYVASKHGVVGLTKAAALEQGPHGIRVNALCPGAVDTPMLYRSTPPDELKEYVDDTPLRRIASPEEMAATVLWLCSDASSFITGVALPTDGGFIVE